MPLQVLESVQVVIALQTAESEVEWLCRTADRTFHGLRRLSSPRGEALLWMRSRHEMPMPEMRESSEVAHERNPMDAPDESPKSELSA